MKPITILILLIATVAVSGLGCSGAVSSEDWRQDLRTLERELEARHVDLYHSVSKDAFEAAADDLYVRIPTLSPPEILVGFAQLVAMVGDGHTSFYPGDQKQWRFRYYPLYLYSFADGIYLTVAAEEYAHLFGKRLVQIDDTPIDDAFRAVSTTVGADNDMEYQYTVPFELTRPELLHALGITDSSDEATFVFEDGTRQTLPALSIDEWRNTDWMVVSELFAPEHKSPSLRLEALFATKLTLPHLIERKYYWYEYLDDHRTMFFQYNACWDQKDRPPFKDVVEEMFAFMDSNPVERLVIDLRQNTGGEPLIAEPLIEELERRAEFGAEGRLFVLVGRRTFSAALTNAAQLRSRAGARTVGEPPRGKPNNPSEGRDIDFKRTGTWVTVSTQFVERDAALGDADYLPIDIEATYTFDVYRRAMDPMLGAAMSAAPYPASSKDH